MGKYTDQEEKVLKNEYIRLKNKGSVEGSVYGKISDTLHSKGFDRSPEAVRKKVDRLGLPPLKENEGVRTAIVVSDLHIPYQDKKALSLVEKYMDDKDWDIYINLGDLLDLPQISHYNKRKPRVVENMRLKEDFDEAEEVLRRHRDIVGSDCEMYLLQGNHDARLQRYLDQNPEHEGLIEIPNCLPLDELDIQWLQSYWRGEHLTIGECTLLHGEFANKYHAKRHCQTYMKNVLYGHLHSYQSFSIQTPNDEVYMGQSIGCLCEYDQQYKKGEPDDWQHGFCEMHFKPDGNFNHYPIRIFDYEFISPKGEVYAL